MREPAPTLLAGLGALLLVGALLTAYQVAGTSYNPRRALLETQEGDGTGVAARRRPPAASVLAPGAALHGVATEVHRCRSLGTIR